MVLLIEFKQANPRSTGVADATIKAKVKHDNAPPPGKCIATEPINPVIAKHTRSIPRMKWECS
ncbi:unnamed protein product [Schistosoma curassoni]|uniref:Glu_synthase domain-containing protein n=1 Tax=Schistosoma curassoni TaxID=6186 RepID=A0A183JCI9_9TREM|nr:unnamed protein product [Schistosoma curassoni]